MLKLFLFVSCILLFSSLIKLWWFAWEFQSDHFLFWLSIYSTAPSDPHLLSPVTAPDHHWLIGKMHRYLSFNNDLAINFILLNYVLPILKSTSMHVLRMCLRLLIQIKLTIFNSISYTKEFIVTLFSISQPALIGLSLYPQLTEAGHQRKS